MSYMRRPSALIIAALLAPPTIAAQEVDGWRTARWVSLFGSFEGSQGGWSPGLALPGPGPAAGAALAMEAQRHSQETDFRASALGSLRRHWLSDDWGGGSAWAHSVWASGRGVWSSSSSFRIWLDESVRAERLPGFGDLARNQVSVGLESRVGGRGGLTLTLADRRRSVDETPDLGFARQTIVIGGAATLSGRHALGLEAGLQTYQANTARGERLIASAEYSAVRRTGVTALRAAWWEPLGDRGEAVALGPVEAPVPVDATNRSVPLESDPQPAAEAGPGQTVGLSEPPPDFVTDALYLDSFLESDADEWDFGRRKLLLVAFHSHRFGDRWFLSGLVRAQRRHGPDLLDAWRGSASFEDTRLHLRLVARYRLSARATILVQASHLESVSERPDFDFSRELVAVGLHWRF